MNKSFNANLLPLKANNITCVLNDFSNAYQKAIIKHIDHLMIPCCKDSIKQRLIILKDKSQ